MKERQTESNKALLVAVAADKGGVGKTTLAYELAAVTGGLALDLDWSHGGMTRMWGFDPASQRRARLLDSFETGMAPRPLYAPRRPALVPSHPDLGATTLDAETVADSLEAWAGTWRRANCAVPPPSNHFPFVFVDTHPGANPLTDGAMAAADLVVVPVVLGGRELDALDGMLADFSDYNVLLVPSMVVSSPPRRWVDRLVGAARNADVPVAPPVSRYTGIPRRIRRSALTLEPNPGAWVGRAATEYAKVAETVKGICCG